MSLHYAQNNMYKIQLATPVFLTLSNGIRYLRNKTSSLGEHVSN